VKETQALSKPPEWSHSLNADRIGPVYHEREAKAAQASGRHVNDRAVFVVYPYGAAAASFGVEDPGQESFAPII
jgi:hypothetical protein